MFADNVWYHISHCLSRSIEEGWEALRMRTTVEGQESVEKAKKRRDVSV